MATPAQTPFVSILNEPGDELDDPWFRASRPSTPPASHRPSGIVPRARRSEPPVGDDELEESWFR